MRDKNRSLLLALAIWLGAGLALAQNPKTVAIDCTKGDSVQKALEDKATDLVIEIRGVCQEEVVVRRDRVTLRGADPASDGIRALDPSRIWSAPILVREARNIRVENLTLSNGWNGLRVSNTRRIVEAVNCRFVDNSSAGLAAVGSAVVISDGFFSANGGFGLVAVESSLVTCERCTIRDNPAAGEGIAVNVDLGSALTIADNSFLSGESGATAGRNSLLRLDGSTIDAQNDAVSVRNGSEAIVTSSQIGGAIFVVRNSLLQIIGVQQTSNPLGENQVLFDSSLIVQSPGNPSSLMGTLFVGPLSRGSIVGPGSVNQGDLVCDAGNLADFACADPFQQITGETQDCRGCAKPPACVATSGQEYVLSGSSNPSAGIFVDDFLRVYVNGSLIAEINQGGGCCPPAPPIRFLANSGDQLRVVAQDGNNCYSLGDLYLQKANGSCLTQLVAAFSGPACGSEPPEQVFFDQTFTLP